MDDNSLMPFGKHKGERLELVPASYLLWFAEQEWCDTWPDLLEYVNEHLELLEELRYVEHP